ncbi:MAG: hypothetical protein HW421_1695 [Ignavibacteria bacterium]|nr:hypothetical protein [Ignavibacteria bacterium]
METITIEINNKRNASNFAALAKNLKYVKSVRFGNNNEQQPLTDDDWARPGRPATEAELETRINEYDTDEGRYTSQEVRMFAKEELAKYRANK